MMSNSNMISGQIQKVAREFIHEYYVDESSLFDVFWDAFSSRLDAELLDSSENRSLPEIETVVKDISFAQPNAVDLVTPVILATVTETVAQINAKKLTSTKIEDFVGNVAAKFGAGVELTACLMRHLPALCKEALSVKQDAGEAVVSKADSPRFQIWANGEKKIVDSIDKYEKRKKEYLFWIDLDEGTHKSELNPKKSIGPEAIKIFMRLVESLGTRVAVSEFLGEQYDTRNDSDNPDKNKIEQQLTKLHQFCNGKFRGYLFGNWFVNGLGLKDSFADKYLLFSRLSPSKS